MARLLVNIAYSVTDVLNVASPSISAAAHGSELGGWKYAPYTPPVGRLEHVSVICWYDALKVGVLVVALSCTK